VSGDSRTASIAGATVPGARPGAAPRQPGTRIGRYHVESVVGQGGQGVVLAALDPLLHRHVAIKLLRADRGAHAELLREGQAIARLRHPNVITVFDVGSDGEDLFIAMELVRGTTLHGWLGAAPRGWREVLARFVPAARGLAAAHAAGLAHGDFKPANVLLGDDGRVVVGDFGLARVAGDDAGTAQDAIHGTPAYLAPEQWDGAPADARSDQFGFCVALYEALYGARPFDVRDGAGVAVIADAVRTGRRAPRPRARVPGWLARALERGLAIEPAARFASMDALIAALVPRRRRARWIAAGATVAVIAAAAAIGLGATPGSRVLGAAPGCEAAARRADRLRATTGPHAAWFAAAAARWSSLERAVCLRQAPDEAAAAARACLRRALAGIEEAAQRDGASWPALPALGDCLSPPPTLRALPSTILVGPQGVATLAPDGRSTAVTSYGGDAVVVDLDDPGAPPRPLAGVWAVLDWLPDGRWLVQGRDGVVALRDARGGVDELTRVPRFRPQTASISPDARWLAVELGDRVEVRDRTGAVRATIPGDDEDLSWEPDSARVAIAVDGALQIHDVRTGSTIAIPLGAGGGALGMHRLVWSAPGRLLLNGAFDDTLRGGIWEVRVGERGLIGYPELRLVPDDDQLYMPEDARGGRLVIARFSTVTRLYERRGGRAVELPASLNALRLLAADTGRGIALASGPSGVVRIDLASHAPALQPAPTGRPVLRDGRVEELRGLGGDRWWLGATGEPGRELRFAGDGVEVRCGHADSSRCVLAGRRGTTLAIAPLDAPDAVLELRGGSGSPAVSPDGDRVLVAQRTGVAEADLARRHIVRIDPVPDGCAIFGVGWEVRGGGRWASIACPDRFAVIRWTRPGVFEELVTSDGWISGVVSLGPGEILYSMQDHDPRLFEVDGLR